MRSLLAARTLTLRVQPGRDILVEELDSLARQLRDEIEELRIAEAELLRGEAAPARTKSLGEAVTLGALSLAILPQAVPKLIEFLQGWSLRGEGRKVAISVERGDRKVALEYSAGALSPEDVRVLVDDVARALVDSPAKG